MKQIKLSCLMKAKNVLFHLLYGSLICSKRLQSNTVTPLDIECFGTSPITNSFLDRQRRLGKGWLGSVRVRQHDNLAALGLGSVGSKSNRQQDHRQWE